MSSEACATPNAEALFMHWVNEGLIAQNWGDKLNPELVSHLSGRPVFHWKDWPDLSRAGDVYSVIGSHIARSRSNWIVWGTGFINSKDQIKTAPRAVRAVRGPLTREKLLAQGIDCPKIYGDPALLYPALYPAQRRPEWDLGIIQHIRESKVVPLPRRCGEISVKVIDITGCLRDVVDEIVRCRRIVSSSLHGLIASHAYGVPAVWVKGSNLPKGDGVKFRDYWSTIGQPAVEPRIVDVDTTAEELAELRFPVRNTPDIAALVDACPFMSDARKQEINALASTHFRMSDIIGA